MEYSDLELLSLTAGYQIHKRCFVYCGDFRCNCGIAFRNQFKLSDSDLMRLNELLKLYGD